MKGLLICDKYQLRLGNSRMEGIYVHFEKTTFDAKLMEFLKVIRPTAKPAILARHRVVHNCILQDACLKFPSLLFVETNSVIS